MATAAATDGTLWRRSSGAAVSLVVLLSFVVLLQEGFSRGDRSTLPAEALHSSTADAQQRVDNEGAHAVGPDRDTAVVGVAGANALSPPSLVSRDPPRNHLQEASRQRDSGGATCANAGVGTMFPPWPLFQEHYAWQLEAKCHGGGIGEGGGGSPKQRCHTNLTAALMRYYVDEFAKQLLQRTRTVNARDDVIVSSFPGQAGWVTLGDSMQTEARLANIRHLLVDAAHRGLSGNFLEAGVWRGGGSLYARMIQTYFTSRNSHVFVCDSFEGLPPARDERHAWENYYAKWRYLSVPLDKVQGIFRRYGLDDPQHVHFFKGFFNESMPRVRAELLRSGTKLSVLRLDGDMYESTIDILYQLYDLVEVGGWIVIDDWNWNERNLKRPLFGALPASLDFRRLHGIEDSDHGMIDIDGVGAFWRKAREVQLLRDRYPDRVYPDTPVTMKDFAALRDKWNRERPKPWPPAHCW